MSFEFATYDYRANTLLLVPGALYDEGDMPRLLDMDVRVDLGGIRELIGDYIVNVRKGILRPDADAHWRIVGNDWDAGLHQAAAKPVRSGAIPLPVDNERSGVTSRSITASDVASVLD